ncbi:TIR-only protein-like [Tripterygium wilfordii]|uniref:TIR-only protein-like n=1 Tax=Tripterygium wilfordii TaxID=458696 RepID=UPI0018F8455F|nr:TIR-only protein-like [Tripterygium wilfordii]
MQYPTTSSIMNLQRHLYRQKRDVKRCDVFINHRGTDTKRTLVTLLYDNLTRLNLRPFLDNKTMKPGDKLFDHINSAIRSCKLGVAVFSPNYCESYFCLHELALFMESKKKVIPIFCDIKRSELRVVNNGVYPEKDVLRFNQALEEAKYTNGLVFDSLKGNWSEVVNSASDMIIRSLIEIENQARMDQLNIQMHQLMKHYTTST